MSGRGERVTELCEEGGPFPPFAWFRFCLCPCRRRSLGSPGPRYSPRSFPVVSTSRTRLAIVASLIVSSHTGMPLICFIKARSLSIFSARWATHPSIPSRLISRRNR